MDQDFYERSAGGSADMSHVLFRTQSSPSDDAVFVRLQPMQGKARLVPLERVKDTSWWEVRLQLQPDVYRYRYYRKAGSTIMYHPPSADDEQRSGLWDAVLKVPALKEDRSRPRYDFLTAESA